MPGARPRDAINKHLVIHLRQDCRESLLLAGNLHGRHLRGGQLGRDGDLLGRLLQDGLHGNRGIEVRLHLPGEVGKEESELWSRGVPNDRTGNVNPLESLVGGIANHVPLASDSCGHRKTLRVELEAAGEKTKAGTV